MVVEVVVAMKLMRRRRRRRRRNREPLEEEAEAAEENKFSSWVALCQMFSDSNFDNESPVQTEDLTL